MPGLLVTQGEAIMLQALVNKQPGQHLVLKLYQNDITPQKTQTEADYREADFAGYRAIPLVGAAWTSTGSRVTYAEQTFESSADQDAQTIYGYYYVQAVSGKLIAPERFATAFKIQNAGDAIKITPVLAQ